MMKPTFKPAVSSKNAVLRDSETPKIKPAGQCLQLSDGLLRIWNEATARALGMGV